MSGDVNLQLLTLREFTPELLARGQARLVAESLRLLPDAVRDNLPAASALEALVLRSLRRYDAAKAAADLALTGRPVRGDREPDRELQTDLAILEVWEARRGWRPWRRPRPVPSRCCDCRHDGSDTHRGPRHLRRLASPQRLADAGPRGPPAVGGRPGLRRRARARREPLRPPGGPSPSQLRRALGTASLELAHLGLPERRRVGAGLPRPAPIRRPGAEPGQQPRAPGPRLGALPCPPDRCGRCRSGSRGGGPARVTRPDRPRLHQVAEGEPADRPWCRGVGLPAAGHAGAPSRTGYHRSPIATPGWLASRPPGESET